MLNFTVTNFPSVNQHANATLLEFLPFPAFAKVRLISCKTFTLQS